MNNMFSTTLADFQQTVTTFCINNNLTTLPQHAYQVLTCFIVYEGLFLVVSPLISEILFPNSYGRSPKRTKLNWDSRVVSFVQATFVSYKALQVILGDGVRPGENVASEVPRSRMTRDDRLWGYSPSTGDVQAYAAGYFLWDVLLCVRYLEIQGVSALLHAVSALIITVMGFVSAISRISFSSSLFPLSTADRTNKSLDSAHSPTSMASTSSSMNYQHHSSTSTGFSTRLARRARLSNSSTASVSSSLSSAVVSCGETIRP